MTDDASDTKPSNGGITDCWLLPRTWSATLESVGSAETPMCSVPPNRIRILRREMDGDPQHSSLRTMSAS